MHCDSAYIIGKSHQVCQDYARHGDGYCLISDGCSGSPHTDIGARLLVLAAEQIMRDLPDLPWGEWGGNFFQAAAVIAAIRAKDLGFPLEAIDATLYALRAAEEGGKKTILAYTCGDGAVATLQKKKGNIQEIQVGQIIYDDNCPYYPSYLLDETRGPRRRPGKLEFFYIGTDGEIGKPSSWPIYDKQVFLSSETEFVAIFSDGIASMTERVESETSICQKPVPVAEVIKELLAFKGFAGQFVQRRVQAFLRECKLKGREFSDDVSIAVMKFD